MRDIQYIAKLALTATLLTACGEDKSGGEREEPTQAGKETDSGQDADTPTPDPGEENATANKELRSSTAVEADAALWQLMKNEHQDYADVIGQSSSLPGLSPLKTRHF